MVQESNQKIFLSPEPVLTALLSGMQKTYLLLSFLQLAQVKSTQTLCPPSQKIHKSSHQRFLQLKALVNGIRPEAWKTGGVAELLLNNIFPVVDHSELREKIVTELLWFISFPHSSLFLILEPIYLFFPLGNSSHECKLTCRDGLHQLWYSGTFTGKENLINQKEKNLSLVFSFFLTVFLPSPLSISLSLSGFLSSFSYLLIYIFLDYLLFLHLISCTNPFFSPLFFYVFSLCCFRCFLQLFSDCFLLCSCSTGKKEKRKTESV